MKETRCSWLYWASHPLTACCLGDLAVEGRSVYKYFYTILSSMYSLTVSDFSQLWTPWVMYDVVEAHAMYGCCAAIVSHVRIYIWVSADWNDDRQRVKTHLPGVEGGVWWSHVWGRGQRVQLPAVGQWVGSDCGECRTWNPNVHETEALTHHYCCQHSLLHFTPSMEGNKGNVCVHVHACVCLWLPSISKWLYYVNIICERGNALP